MSEAKVEVKGRHKFDAPAWASPATGVKHCRAIRGRGFCLKRESDPVHLTGDEGRSQLLERLTTSINTEAKTEVKLSELAEAKREVECLMATQERLLNDATELRRISDGYRAGKLKAEAALAEMRAEGQRDYDGMREFQAKFIAADQALAAMTDRANIAETLEVHLRAERDAALSREQEARGLLNSALEWTAGYPLQGPESYADRHAADYLHGRIDAFLAKPLAPQPCERMTVDGACGTDHEWIDGVAYHRRPPQVHRWKRKDAGGTVTVTCEVPAPQAETPRDLPSGRHSYVASTHWADYAAFCDKCGKPESDQIHG